MRLATTRLELMHRKGAAFEAQQQNRRQETRLSLDLSRYVPCPRCVALCVQQLSGREDKHQWMEAGISTAHWAHALNPRGGNRPSASLQVVSGGGFRGGGGDKRLPAGRRAESIPQAWPKVTKSAFEGFFSPSMRAVLMCDLWETKSRGPRWRSNHFRRQQWMSDRASMLAEV